MYCLLCIFTGYNNKFKMDEIDIVCPCMVTENPKVIIIIVYILLF